MRIPESIKDLATSSGNSFHTRVVNALRERNWHVLVSPYYLDGSTDRAREIDLIAEKPWDWEPHLKHPVRLNVRLVVECKYVSRDTLFWFDTKDEAKAAEWVHANTPLPPDNKYTSEHHYLSRCAEVAKVFATSDDRSRQNESIYLALNQVLHAMIYFRRTGSIAPSSRRTVKEATVEIPVVVVNSFDSFYRTDMNGGGDVSPITDLFELEVDYAYIDAKKNNRRGYFLVDVVPLDAIDDFFGWLETDVTAIQQIWP